MFFYWTYFTFFFGHYIEQNICLYEFSQTIFYKITVLYQCQTNKNMPVWVLHFIKVAGSRPAPLLKLNFFTDIFERFCLYNQFDTLQNSYFEEYSFLRSSSPEVFCIKGAFKSLAKFTAKHQCLAQPHFKYRWTSQPPTLLKNRLWHSCFSVSFVKFLKTSFLHIISERLLLYFYRAPFSKAASIHLSNSDD